MNKMDFVDVGGYRLLVTCQGEGPPSVIILASQFDTVDDWQPVLSAVSEFTHVCYYDRGGVGASEAGPVPRTSHTIATELHVLTGEANLKGPFVFVAASFGAFVCRLYAAEYPHQVAGAVFVDGEHPDQRTRLKGHLPKGWAWRPFEGVDWEASAAEVRAARSLSDLPLIVLAAQDHKFLPTGEEAWLRMQEEHANISAKAQLIMVAESGHHIYVDRPSIVVDAVRTVVDKVRGIPK